MADDDVDEWLGISDKGLPPPKPQTPMPVQSPMPRASVPSNAGVIRELQQLNEHAAKIRNWVGWITVWVVVIPALLLAFGFAAFFLRLFDR